MMTTHGERARAALEQHGELTFEELYAHAGNGSSAHSFRSGLVRFLRSGGCVAEKFQQGRYTLCRYRLPAPAEFGRVREAPTCPPTLQSRMERRAMELALARAHELYAIRSLKP